MQGMVSFGQAIAHHAREQPDRLAVTCADDAITFAELHRRTNLLARAYASLGVEAGDMVTIALPNSVEFLVACVAVWKLGATAQPCSPVLPERERQAIVELADSALVVGAPPESHPSRTVLPAGFEPDPTLGDGDLPDVVSARWKAPTSGGSTGRPKLIVSADPGLVDLGSPRGTLPLREAVCVPGPLYHNAPFTYASSALVRGNHVALLPRFDAEATLAAVHEHRAVLLLLVPTMMQRIARLPEEVRDRYDVSSLRFVWHMAAPCPAWLKEWWIDWLGGERIYELYAGTEAQAVTVVRGDEWLARRGTVGRPTSGMIRIQDPETLEILPPGQVGEVFMHPGPDRRTYEYVGAEARATDDGWESLGDMGWVDEDGYLFLADRRSDMILSGGANIYPAEVEGALDEHPAVVSSAVIGLPDEDLGQRVHAVVQVTAEGAVGEEELRAFVAERLVRYKVPRSFELTTDVVRGHDGKVRRSALREARSAG